MTGEKEKVVNCHKQTNTYGYNLNEKDHIVHYTCPIKIYNPSEGFLYPYH